MASLGAKPAEGATKATCDGEEPGGNPKLTPYGTPEGSTTVASQAEITPSKYVPILIILISPYARKQLFYYNCNYQMSFNNDTQIKYTLSNTPD